MSDGRWRSLWIGFAALAVLIWVMAQDRMLMDELWSAWLSVWGWLP